MAKKGLKTWFKENWVDISTGKKCGRKSAKSSKRKYPVCRPKAVADRMTAGQKAAAVRRKRAKTNTGPKPTSIRYPISASGRKQKVKTKRRKNIIIGIGAGLIGLAAIAFEVYVLTNL